MVGSRPMAAAMAILSLFFFTLSVGPTNAESSGLDEFPEAGQGTNLPEMKPGWVLSENPVPGSHGVFNAAAFGAGPDDPILDHDAIQAAIDRAGDVCGTVRLPSGTFLLGGDNRDGSDSYVFSLHLDGPQSCVTVEGAGPRATTLAVADGENVGGIRVGRGDTQAFPGDTVTGVTLRNFGVDGNHPAQDPSVKWLHGIDLRNCLNCRVENVFVTRTSPYHEHVTGGSGIEIGGCSRFVDVDNVHIDDIGKQGVEVGGRHVTIKNSRFTDGFDRHVGLARADLSGHDLSSWVTVRNNLFGRHAEGSHVGVTLENPGEVHGHWTVANNRSIGRGQVNKFVYFGKIGRKNNYRDIVIRDNEMIHYNEGFDTDPAIKITTGGRGRNIQIVDNFISGKGWSAGMNVNADTVLISGNHIEVPGNDRKGIVVNPRSRNVSLIGNSVGGLVLEGGDVQFRSKPNLNFRIKDRDGRTVLGSLHPDASLNPFGKTATYLPGILTDRSGTPLLDVEEREHRAASIKLDDTDDDGDHWVIEENENGDLQARHTGNGETTVLAEQ